MPDGLEGADRARVLLVDDDERNLLAIRTVIEDIAEVVTASSGEEALRHLLRGDFAVILLDVYMPGIDGYETASIIRSRPQTKRIPIVFLSAVNKESEHLIRGYEMGAVDYVFKPVEPLVLRSKVAVFVDLFLATREVKRKAAHEQRLLDENLRANAEKLQVEQELRLAQQRQQAIIESLPIVLYLEPLDAEPRQPAFVSGNFEAVTGYKLDDVRKQPTLWADRLHPEDRDRVLNAFAARGRTGAFSIEYRWQCASGDHKHFLDQAVVLNDASGKPVEFAGTLMDVTDRKLLETQLVHAQKMDAIGQLTGGIAHDFNNLLAAVLGGLGMIERRVKLDERQAEVLRMTRHAADQGTELVRRLLAFARRQKLEPAPVEVSGLAANVTQLLQHTLGGRVELGWDVQDGVWPAFADEAQLELALVNLVINARDAMPEGGTVTISARNRALVNGEIPGLSAGDYLSLEVADTGTGIAPEHLQRVLEPFFTTKEVGKGTGLGLPMVYGFAKQSNGTVLIDSGQGEGTRVTLLLPRAPADALRRNGQPNGAVFGALQQDCTLAIALIDDDEPVRLTTAALLEDLGHAVAHAGEADPALDALRRDPGCYDLIVTDFAMPALSGVELIRRARAHAPHVPALIITGYADLAPLADRPSDVMVLAKPFTAEAMRAAINKVCAARPPQRIAAE